MDVTAKNTMRIAVVVAVLLVLVILPAGCDIIRGGAEFEGTRWRLARWSEPLADPTEFEITAEFTDSEITGQAPVNQYGGTYTAGPGGDFSVTDVAQTLMAGPEPAMDAEEAYFSLLGAAFSYQMIDEMLVLFNESGIEILAFEEM